jgi:broad specificity phosphatase PhoE
VTTVYLVRHAEKASDPDILTGRSRGIHLSERGKGQAERLGAWFSLRPVDAIWCSPMERARETAEEIARTTNRVVQISEAITEFDFGGWTGRRVSELEDNPQWRRFNEFRSATRIPGGELIAEVQVRVVKEILHLAAEVPNGSVVLVSHGDPIRAALGYFLQSPLDAMNRIEVSVASISMLALHDDTVRVLRINHEPDAES